MSGGNFASLADCLLVRKGEAEPSPVGASATSAIEQRAAPAPVDALLPDRPPRRSKRRELPAPSTAAVESAKPRPLFVQLSANEYEALGLVAVKKDTTPQHLLRKVLHDFLVEFVEQCDGYSGRQG